VRCRRCGVEVIGHDVCPGCGAEIAGGRGGSARARRGADREAPGDVSNAQSVPQQLPASTPSSPVASAEVHADSKIMHRGEWGAILGALALVAALLCVVPWLVASYVLVQASLDGSVPLAGKPLTLTGARGEVLRFVITGRSAGSRWRAEGLRLRYLSSERIPPTAIDTSGEQDWDEDITVSGGDDGIFEVEASLTVPDSLESGRTSLEGHIMGSVEYPGVVGLTEYEDVHKDLKIPVSLHVTASDAHAVARTVQDTARLGMIIGVVVSVAAFAFWGLRASREVYRTVVCPQCGRDNRVRLSVTKASCGRCGEELPR
jgi:hypothetical protein